VWCQENATNSKQPPLPRLQKNTRSIIFTPSPRLPINRQYEAVVPLMGVMGFATPDTLTRQAYFTTWFSSYTLNHNFIRGNPSGADYASLQNSNEQCFS